MLSGVGFLEPLFLWALLFLGAVLLIHLLKRPRTIRLAFSSLRFFDASSVVAHRSRRLRKLLLLIVRLLLVTLLVALFAGPFLKNDPLRIIRDPHHDLYVWIDQTPSMSYRENGLSINETARTLIDTLACVRRTTSGMFLYDDDRQEFVTYSEGRDVPFRLRYGAQIASLRQACSRAMRMSKRPVFLIASDFQEKTTAALEAVRSSAIPAATPVIGVPMAPVKPWNTAIVQVRSSGDKETVVTTRLVSEGEKGFAGSCFVTIDNIRMPPLPCTLAAPGDTIVTMLTHGRGDDGWGSVTLQGDDPLSFDNTGYFVAGRGGGCSVLIIGDETENYPITAALRASDDKQWNPIVVSAPEMVTFEACASADLIIVNGCRILTPLLPMLQNMAGTKRQAFIVAAGGNDTALQAGAPLLSNLQVKGVLRKADPPLAAKLPDTISGLWRGFPSLQCPDVRVHAYCGGLPGMPLVKLTNEMPLAVRAADRFGRPCIIAATPIGISAANNLCETGFYVPFIDRLARSVCAQLGDRGEVWIAGTTIKNPWYGNPNPTQIFTADGKPFMQLQQQPVFTIELPGVYKIVPATQRPFLKVVAADGLESRLDYRLPGNNDAVSNRWIIVRPHELLSYVKEHRRTVGWIVPWLLLGLLLLGELLLREYKRP